jgi:hypothetical protein
VLTGVPVEDGGRVEATNGSLLDGIETKDLFKQVMYVRQAFRKTALLLSSGAVFGTSHVRVIKALRDVKLLP